MNQDLSHIKLLIGRSSLAGEEKQHLLEEVSRADKQWNILAFKLERTEKVKRTTAVLLEETIEELENKRAAVEEARTALERSLEELKAAQQQLIQSEKMASLGELTAGIAHEIQNPLNFVNNFSEVSTELIDELKQEAAAGNMEDVVAIAGYLDENLKKITHHGKRADAIVKSMLEHSRTRTGRKEPTDINALVDEYVRLSYQAMRTRYPSLHANFTTHPAEAAGKINIVAQDIARVLLNLFNNAFYAVMQKQRQADSTYTPEISVTTKRLDGFIEIMISDNGPGIPPKALEKIFQPFFTTKPTGEGTGLGLSLSYDIITQGHGGEIKVQSEEGKGAQFTILLPA